MALRKDHIPAKQVIQAGTLIRAGMVYLLAIGAGTIQIGSEEKNLKSYAQGAIAIDSTTAAGTVIWWQGPMFLYSDTDMDVMIEIPQMTPSYSLEEARMRGVI